MKIVTHETKKGGVLFYVFCYVCNKNTKEG